MTWRRQARRAVLAALLAPVLCLPQESAARAMKLMESRDFAAAASMLRQLLAQAPQDAALWNLAGICESELNRAAEARAAFEHGLKLAPDSIPLNENLGFLYFRQEDYAAARTYLAKAVSLGSGKPGVAFSLAASRIRTGEPKEGLAALVALENQLGNASDYWTERGWVELRQNPAAAPASFDRALRLAPDDVRALNGAASAAEAAHEEERALSLLLRARKAHPDDVRTLLHFASLCLRRDLSVDALDAVERARKLAPANNLALFLHARVRIAFQEWREAHTLFTEFDRRVPGYAPVHYALGWLDIKLNQAEEARQHLEKSLALDPGLVDARCELGQLDLDQGRLDAAGANLRAVLEQQPRHAKANIALGDVMLRSGNLAEAKARYEAAIEADPQSGPAHYKLSTVLLRLQEPERAAKERALGARLNADALHASKTVLVLAEPDGTLLADSARKARP